MTQPPATRPSLLIRIRDADDTEAWELFLELYVPLLYGFFRKRGVQNADAADLTQDVLQTVAAHAVRLEYDPARGTFRSWLYTVACNRLRDFIAREKRSLRGTGDTVTIRVLESIPAPEEEDTLWQPEYEQRVFSWAAEQVRAQVTDSTWQAFWQTAVVGKSGEETANSLEMSVGAVYAAKSRVLARLREKVRQIEGEGHDQCVG